MAYYVDPSKQDSKFKYTASIRLGELELRVCPDRLNRPDGEIVCWFNTSTETESCCTYASWRKDSEGYQLHFCGSRPMKLEDWSDFKRLASLGQSMMDLLFLINREP
jgi:hypothetical protein